jgi:hypothetical protein
MSEILDSLAGLEQQIARLQYERAVAQAREQGAFLAGYAMGAALERINPEFAWAIYSGKVQPEVPHA